MKKILYVVVFLFLLWILFLLLKQFELLHAQKVQIEELRKNFEKLQERVEKIEQGKNEFIFTGYSSTREECDDTPFITASNKRVRWGIVGMDRKYPFGTKLYIPYFRQVFVCEDRGGAIEGNRVDIWFPSKEAALKFGRKKLVAYVIGR